MSDRPEGVTEDGDILEWLQRQSDEGRAAVAAVRKRRRELERTVPRNAVPEHAYPRED